MITITALAYPAYGQSADDVLAEALATQHERAGIEDAYRAPIPNSPMVRLILTYAEGAADAEYYDCAERLKQTRCGGIDTIRIWR